MSPIGWDAAIALAFVLGLLLFGIGSSMLRAARKEPRKPLIPKWTVLVDESLENADKALRLDMVERLSIVRTDWSREVLAQARAQEHDPEVLSAIETALSRTTASC